MKDAELKSLDSFVTSVKMEEEYRLGGRKPFSTLLHLAVGPLLSHVGSTSYGVVDNIWIKKAFGKVGTSAVGCVFVMQYLIHGFSQTLNVSVTSKLGFLHAQNLNKKCRKVLFDIFRVALVMCIVIPALILPIAHPIMSLLHVGEKSQKNGFQFLIPLCAGYFVTALYHLLCAILQANGRSIAYGCAHLACNVLNMGVFEPILLLVLKTGIWGVSLATILSELVVSISLILYIKKFKLVPESEKEMRFFGKFSKHSKSALKSGMSALVNEIAMVLPCVLIQLYLSASARSQGVSTEVMGVWHIMARVYNVCTMLMGTATAAFRPAASFAFGGGRGRRLMWLTIHIFWIGTLWAVICSFAFSVFPGEICTIWSSDATFTEWLKKMIPPSVYTAALTPLRAIVSSLFQCMKKGNWASSLHFFAQMVALPVISTALYVTKKDDPVRIVWCYVYTDIAAFVISALYAIVPFRIIRNMIDKEGPEKELTRQLL